MTDFRARAEALRAQISTAAGVTDPALRRSILAQVEGGPPAGEPYAALAGQIAEAAYRVTDAQVSEVRRATGSDKGAFEVVMTAAVAAGLWRFRLAMQTLETVPNASGRDR